MLEQRRDFILEIFSVRCEVVWPDRSDDKISAVICLDDILNISTLCIIFC